MLNSHGVKLTLTGSEVTMASNEKRKFDEDEENGLLDSVSKQRKVIGPSLPPSQDQEAADATKSETDNDSDDDDDDFGPSLPPSGPLGSPMQSGSTGASATNATNATDSEAKDTQRDQWMLQPPTHSDWASKIDPTQLRNRKFNTGKSATAPKTMDSSWTETPEERMRRLQDAVMGVGSSTSQTANRTGASNAKLMEEQIKKYKVSFNLSCDILLRFVFFLFFSSGSI